MCELRESVRLRYRYGGQAQTPVQHCPRIDGAVNPELSTRVDQAQRWVPPFDIHHGLGMRSAVGDEMFERPAVEDERLFNGGLVQRCVHRFTKSRVAETAPRPIHANRRPVDDDAHGLRAANEQPRFRRT